MIIAEGSAGRSEQIVAMVARTFTASAGEVEGAIVGGLARDLLATTPIADIRVFRAEEADRIVGAAIFTRLVYPEDGRLVMLLSPMAVATDHQRRGVGQRLLTQALAALAASGVVAAVTYGDPAYYRRVGFEPIGEDLARAPLPLAMPHGWLGRPLAAGPFPRLVGPSTCVTALHRPDVW